MVKGLLCSVKLGAVLTCSCRCFFFFSSQNGARTEKKTSSAWHMPMAFSVNISLHDIWMCYTMYAFLSLSLCEMRVILSSFFLRCFGWKLFNWGKGLLLGMYLFSVYLCCWYATLSPPSSPGTTPGTENEFWPVFMRSYPWVHGTDHQGSKRAAISVVVMLSLILATKVVLANVQ